MNVKFQFHDYSGRKDSMFETAKKFDCKATLTEGHDGWQELYTIEMDINSFPLFYMAECLDDDGKGTTLPKSEYYEIKDNSLYYINGQS